jgi:hypothetical protein
VEHRTADELEAGLARVRGSPKDVGEVRLIVRRPEIGQREVVVEAALDPRQGLVGDVWIRKPSKRSADGGPHPEMQLTLMNARAAELVSGGVERWPLAGDQLYVDLDLGAANLPAGTRLAVGSAVVEVTAVPHTGCAKFRERYGSDALRWVNSKAGRELNLRGVNAVVVRAGTVRTGDVARKLA